MAEMSNYLEEKLLDHTLGTSAYTHPSTVYLALHTADPTDAGSGAEVDVARQACDLLYHTQVTTSKAVLAGDTITVAAGAVTVTLA